MNLDYEQKANLDLKKNTTSGTRHYCKSIDRTRHGRKFSPWQNGKMPAK